MAYSLDHPRKISACGLLLPTRQRSVLVQRAPAFSSPLQLRWLGYAISNLTGG